jgi:hypothetical protein
MRLNSALFLEKLFRKGPSLCSGRAYRAQSLIGRAFCFTPRDEVKPNEEGFHAKAPRRREFFNNLFIQFLDEE